MANSYPDLLSSKTRMLHPPIVIGGIMNPLNLKTTGLPKLQSSPRAGKTSKEIPYSLFDRLVQFVADKVKMGSAYKLYCLSSNLELLCKKPEEWKKDPMKAKVLECLLEECNDFSEFEAVLEKRLAPISESSLSQGFVISKEMHQNSDSALLKEGSEPSGAYKLQMAFARQGIEKATRRIFAFCESSKVEETFNLHWLSFNVLELMNGCPDIEQNQDINEELNKALTRQFELVLAPASQCPRSQRDNKPKDRPNSLRQEDIFRTVNKNTSDTSSDTAGMVIDSKNAARQTEKRWTELKKVETLLNKAKEAASNKLQSEKTRHAGPIASGEVTSLESGEPSFSTRALKRELKTCFKGYYEVINRERFGSKGAENAISMLYEKLAAMEDSLSKKSPKYMNFFTAEIKRHVIANDTGKEGGLLEKVAIGKKGYIANNGEIKKFQEFKSVRTVLSGAHDAAALSKEKRTVKTN